MAEDGEQEQPVWIDFLNAAGRPLDQALGRRLEAEAAAGAGDAASVLVLCADGERASAISSGLWTFDPASFLAHGGPGDGAPDEHPIWVAEAEPDAPRAAIFVVDDAAPGDWDAYGRRAYLFDAQDPAARDAGRARWREWADAGRRLAYWSFDGAEWRLDRTT